MPLTETGIQNFYDAARHQDFARDFQFRILQLGPNQYNSQYLNQLVYLTTATLPNRAINNQVVPYMGLGFNVPGSVSYPGSDGWAVTFRMPQNHGIRSTLEKWQINTFNDDTSTGDYAIPDRSSVIHLALLNNAGDSIREYVMYGVYVVNLGDVSYDITGSGAPVTFTATLAYQYWRLNKDLQGGNALQSVSPVGPTVV